jgi:hypothetical protein
MLLIGVSDITESRTELLLGQWTTVTHVTGWLQAASNSQNSARTYHVAEQWLSTVPHAPSGPMLLIGVSDITAALTFLCRQRKK